MFVDVFLLLATSEGSFLHHRLCHRFQTEGVCVDIFCDSMNCNEAVISYLRLKGYTELEEVTEELGY